MFEIRKTITSVARVIKKIAQKFFSFLMRHKWLTIIAVVILVIAGLIIWRQSTKTPQYVTDKVTRATVVDEVSESGNIQADGQAEISSSTSGIVNEIYVQNDRYVYNGQALFAVTPDSTDAEKAAAYSQYLQAQANTKTAEQSQAALTVQIRTAKKQLTDAFALYLKIRDDLKINPATTYTKTDLASSEMAYLAAKKNVEVLNNNYNNATVSITAAQETENAAKLAWENKNLVIVKAPRSGYIFNLSVSKGDQVSAATLPGAVVSPVLIIADSNHLLFKSQINEIDISKIKIGQSGTITVDAVKGQDFTGRVTKIDSIGTNTQGVISYNIYLAIENPNQAIKVGMSGNMTVETEKHENVLTVANSAIKPYQNGKAVQVFADEEHKTLKYIPIEVGLKGLDRTEITKGLNEGTEVVITGGVNQFRSNIFGG